MEQPFLFIRWAIFLFLFTGVFANSALASRQLKADGDSLWIEADGNREGFSLSLLSGNDTLRVQEVTAIWIYSTHDSVNVTKSSRFVPVSIVNGVTKYELVIFFDSSQDRFEDRLRDLRKYSTFGGALIPASLNFVYSSPTDSDLTRLRMTYDLDKVAGTGSEVSRLLNLLRWAHKIVPHDGSSANPSPANALNLIRVCADSNRGVNCRMMATILNEVCLSIGFKSRHLTCLPEDKNDGDCHVVNMVWSDSLGKWVYLDPTFQGYFMDSSGMLLSPEEIRTAYIAGDSLVISPELDYNGSAYNPLEYRAYLAKNLFRFIAPLESAFSYESRTGECVWIHLNPVGYDSQLTARADSTSSADHRMIHYYTDNANWFWGR